MGDRSPGPEDHAEMCRVGRVGRIKDTLTALVTRNPRPRVPGVSSHPAIIGSPRGRPPQPDRPNYPPQEDAKQEFGRASEVPGSSRL